ncbi:MAG: hypothetical protein ABSF82_07460 [Candidatus Bathyarchaeia archaeon]|jgi:hypothetical protein
MVFLGEIVTKKAQITLKLGTVIAACLLLGILVGLPTAHASADVEARLTLAIDWISGQQVSSLQYVGFARGTDAETDHTVYSSDQALIALALSDYHTNHNDAQYDNMLHAAATFLSSARTSTGDFYEYYDMKRGSWVHLGDFDSWEVYAIAGLATSAYKIVLKDSGQRAYWLSIESRLKNTVNVFLQHQRSDGAWVFQTRPGYYEAPTRENAILLTGLLYLGLFERNWGSIQQATFYGQLSQRTARWLFSTQNVTAGPLFGGFPTSDLNSTQTSETNGQVLLGVDTYYTIIGVLLSQPSPNLYDARRVMSGWIYGYAEEMRDAYGGPFDGRTATAILQYPKTTLAAIWMLQALADIWINLGGDEFFGVSQHAYDWIVGNNELQLDMQGAANAAGTTGGFYTSISGGGVDKTASTETTAAGVYGIGRAAFTHVPEFPVAEALLLFIVLVGVLAIVERSGGRRSRKPNSHCADEFLA